MYSIRDFAGMIVDKRRTGAYIDALRQTVKPGDVVVDIGCGTGIFSLVACQLGARRVYAIDHNPAIALARAIAADNGMTDRIEFIEDSSTNVELPEPVDVVIADVHGATPLYKESLVTLIDARERLAPGATIIPLRDELMVALVHCPELYARHLSPWSERLYDLDMSAGLKLAINQSGRKSSEAVVPARRWADLDYRTLDTTNITGSAQWTIEQQIEAHGLAVWFDVTLADGVTLSNAPSQPETIYGQVFRPWPEPVTLRPGERVGLDLSAHLIAGDYVWGWTTTIGDPEDPRHAFRQSDFFGTAVSAAVLRKGSAAHVPTLAVDGLADRLILEAMDGTSSLEQIAQRVMVELPEQFPDRRQALDRVAKLSRQYSK